MVERAISAIFSRTGPLGPGDARSDCHAWGSHPAYHLLTGVAGIRPDAAGFARVRVAPQPGGLRWIAAGIPSSKGLVCADLHFDGDRATGTVTLPAGLSGVFVWRGVETPLVPGANRCFSGPSCPASSPL